MNVDGPSLGTALKGLVFTAGLCSMAVEMTASRLLAPYFGSSFNVWTNIIGVMMACLSAGYFYGGRLADRFPSALTLLRLTLASAIATALIPAMAGPVLGWIVENQQMDEFAGSLWASLLLFGPALFLKGMVTPVAIRIAIQNIGDAGRITGSIYALSTVGSLVGTFIPVMITLPMLGTRHTFHTMAALLGVVTLASWSALIAASSTAKA